MVDQVKVQWDLYSPSSTTWENASDLDHCCVEQIVDYGPDHCCVEQMVDYDLDHCCVEQIVDYDPIDET
jgi:hypothetical protein